MEATHNLENRYAEAYQDESEEKYIALLDELHASIQSESNYLLFYYKAQVLCDLHDIYEIRKDKAKQESCLKEAEAAAKESLKMNKGFGLGYALKANILGKMLNVRGPAGGPLIGPKINMAINKAFKYAPEDHRVYVESARRYIFTPPFFGGDLNKAINDLEQALKINKDYPETYFWLGVAYKRKKQLDLAREFFQKALALKKKYYFAEQELKN